MVREVLNCKVSVVVPIDDVVRVVLGHTVSQKMIELIRSQCDHALVMGTS